MTGSWAESVQTRTRLDLEYRILNGDGNFRWYRCRAAPRIDATGEVRRWYGLLEDVHDRQTAFEALIASMPWRDLPTEADKINVRRRFEALSQDEAIGIFELWRAHAFRKRPTEDRVAGVA